MTTPRVTPTPAKAYCASDDDIDCGVLLLLLPLLSLLMNESGDDETGDCCCGSFSRVG
jgi:hypothetical protein